MPTSSNEEEGILLTSLTVPHSCSCPKPGTGSPTSHVVVFCVQ